MYKKINNLPISTTTTLGGVKIGSGLNILNDGTLNTNGSTITTNDWSGKVMTCLGDSITQLLTQHSNTNYHDYVKTRLDLSQVNNYGLSGTCIASNGTGNSFVDRYSGMTNTSDIITVLGGINDWASNVVIGSAGDTVTTTFFGALNTLMPGLIAKYPNQTIVFMTPLKANNVSGTQDTVKGGGKIVDYVNAIKERGQYYGIPVLDLFSTMLDPQISVVNTTYFHDGLHPNDAGHTWIGRRLAKFLNNL